MPSIVVTCGAVGLDGQDRAGLDGLAVDVAGAGAAVGGVTTDVRAGQPQLVAQQVDEQQSGLDLAVVAGAVDLDRHGDAGH